MKRRKRSILEKTVLAYMPTRSCKQSSFTHDYSACNVGNSKLSGLEAVKALREIDNPLLVPGAKLAERGIIVRM